MDHLKLTDYQLVQSFIAGDKFSIETLIKRHKNRLYTYILLIVKDSQLAEDIFQDTFIKVVKSLKRGKYQDKGIFASWVVRIAHNLVIDYFRRKKNLKTVSHDNYEADFFNSKKFSDISIEDIMIQKQIRSDVQDLINQLPLEQREVIILRHYEDFSFKEIADKTGVSINTALGRMRYALINIKKLIKKNKVSLTLH